MTTQTHRRLIDALGIIYAAIKGRAAILIIYFGKRFKGPAMNKLAKALTRVFPFLLKCGRPSTSSSFSHIYNLQKTTFSIMTRRGYEKKLQVNKPDPVQWNYLIEKYPRKHWGIRNEVDSKYLNIPIQY